MVKMKGMIKMKNLFFDTTNVFDAEKKLKGYFNSNNDNKNNFIGTLPVNEDDCTYLLSKLHHLNDSMASLSYYEQIPLCVLVLWTFAIKYKDINPGLLKQTMNYSHSIPQHHFKFYIEMLTNAVAEYSIETFGIDYTNTPGLAKVIEMHAAQKVREEICA